MAYGTLTTTDTLASLRALNLVVATYGEDRVWDAINELLVAHNRIMGELLNGFCDITTDRLRRFGQIDQMAMDEIDEYGTPDAQKVAAGQDVGFPLRKYGAALQWTRTYFQVALVSELAAQFTAALTADVRRVNRTIKNAILQPTNYTFADRLVDKVNLPVKALINADGYGLPPGPNGEQFNGATHQHYMGTAAFGASDLQALITNVLEHYNEGKIEVYINTAQEAVIRTFAGFSAYLDARLLPAIGNPNVGASVINVNNTPQLNVMSIYNRAIGIFFGAEIVVKPWMPANYLFAYNPAQQVPCVIRVRGSAPDGTGAPLADNMSILRGTGTTPGQGDLQMVFEDEEHPLRAQVIEREFGASIQNRINGAVLYTGGASYVAPTITD